MVARGARGSRPAVRALYQPFRPLLLSWVGTEGLRTLTGIEESAQAFTLNDARLACGYYFNELLLLLLGNDQVQDAAFAHYAMALAELSDPEIQYESVLRTFELQLLDVLGLLPDLSRCTADGSDIQADGSYLYHPANAIAVPVAANDGLGLLKQKHHAGEGGTQDPSVHADGMTTDSGIPVSGSTLIALSKLNLSDPEILEQAKPLMRQIINTHLGNRPLKSRDLFRTLQKPPGVGPS